MRVADDEHDRPIATAKHAIERLFVDGTGQGTVTRMRVCPDPGKPGRR